MTRDVFISHSSHDKAIADAICTRLETAGIKCWIAPRDILPGVDFAAAIVEAIEASTIMLLVFSAKSAKSAHVQREVNVAAKSGRIIIPFRIQDVVPSAAMEYILSNTHWLEAITPPLEAHIATLSVTIHQLLGRPPPTLTFTQKLARLVEGAIHTLTIDRKGKWMLATLAAAIGVGLWFFYSATDRASAPAAVRQAAPQMAATKTVKIGSQVWATDNLDVSAFSNGDPIGEAKTEQEWTKANESKTPAWCHLNNDPTNGAKHGKLYNWYAVGDPRGLAPSGFHVPSKAEFETLLANSGGTGASAYVALITGGTTGFNSQLGGCRTNAGAFLPQTRRTAYWSSSEGYRNSGASFNLAVDSEQKSAQLMYYLNGMGYSVRCLHGPKVENSNPGDQYRNTSNVPSSVPAGSATENWAWSRSLVGHSEPAFAVAFSPDGQDLVSGGYDHTARIWRIADGATLQTLVGHDAQITAVAFGDSGRRVLTGDAYGLIRIWRTSDGAGVQTIRAHTKGVRFVQQHGGTIVSAGEDGMLKFWDADTGSNRLTVPLQLPMAFSCAVSPDGTLIAVAGNARGVRIHAFSTGEYQMQIEEPASVLSVAFSPDGKLLCSGSADGKIRIWDLGTGKRTQTLAGHQKEVLSVAFLPGGAQLASCSLDKTIRIWDCATGRCVQTMVGDAKLLLSMALSPDGTSLASAGSDGTVKLWRHAGASTATPAGP